MIVLSSCPARTVLNEKLRRVFVKRQNNSFVHSTIASNHLTMLSDSETQLETTRDESAQLRLADVAREHI